MPDNAGRYGGRITACDGRTYERRIIKDWIAKSDADANSRYAPIIRGVWAHCTLDMPYN